MGTAAGIAVHLPDHVAWLIGTDPINHAVDVGGIELDDRLAADPAEVQSIKQSAEHLHHLEVKVGSFSQSLDVQIGQHHTLGNSGYSITIENFDPAFPMSVHRRKSRRC